MSFDEATYERIREGCQRSAAVLVPTVIQLVEPSSVVDVGCGEGWFAREFARAGCNVLALDETVSHWEFEQIDADHGSGRVDFQHTDLGADGWATNAACEMRALARVHGGKPDADLAVCLEVAEHLPAESADSLVAGLCELAPVVLFSAAIPGQGGHGHLNEQWPDYWADLFLDRGRVANDDLRTAFWDDAEIEPWYRQNLLLYASPDWMDERSLPYGEAYSVVHPDLLAARVSERNAAWAKLRENGLEP